MTDDPPDHQSHTLAELQDVLQRIDRAKYPARYAMALQELQCQEALYTNDPDGVRRALEQSTAQKAGGLGSGCWNGGCLGAIGGIALGTLLPIAWMNVFPLQFTPNSCGMDRGFAMMGIVIMGQMVGLPVGILAGSIAGTLIGRKR
jgi:hypothetical protein